MPIIIDLTPAEARKIHNRLAECTKDAKGVFEEVCRGVLKKRGIDNASTPFELTLGGPVPTLSYSLSG